MNFLQISESAGIARIALARGKVNAINEAVVDELAGAFRKLEEDGNVRAVILTGTGKFFTFGFDIPEFLGYPKDDFVRYLTKFTDFYTYLFTYPKPVIAALNGHTIAGGCMMAIACDGRIMVTGKAKIALNEIDFGSSLFAGSVELMKLWLGQCRAEAAMLGGTMYSPEEALGLGLVDEVVAPEELDAKAESAARRYAEKDPAAFRSIKGLLRKPLADEMRRRERDSILEFVGIWYSEATWKRLQEKKIHG